MDTGRNKSNCAISFRAVNLSLNFYTDFRGHRPKNFDLCKRDCAIKEDTKHTKSTKRAENHCPIAKYLLIVFNLFAIVHIYVFRVFRAFRVFRVNLFNYAMPIPQVEKFC